MKIAFDAKRAFFNRSGLGNYSRSTIDILRNFYPKNTYILYTPKSIPVIDFVDESEKLKIIAPQSFIWQRLHSLWRSFGIVNNLKCECPDIYHGLSNELPIGIQKSAVKSVVTIHDLIFLRFPQFYKNIDRKIYNFKFRYACEKADKIVAISHQTALDIMQFYRIPESKIEIIYQGCSPTFYKKASFDKKAEVKLKYKLPDNYLLSVGTIEPRKNLLSVVKSLKDLNQDISLVVVGKPTIYLQEIKEYILQNGIKNQILFLHNVANQDLPAIYQAAEMFVYTSLFEGFGIPILEALFSEVPVITSKGACFEETGGESTIYVNPEAIGEIKEAIEYVLADKKQMEKMIVDGLSHAQNFKENRIADNLIAFYKKTIGI